MKYLKTCVWKYWGSLNSVNKRLIHSSFVTDRGKKSQLSCDGAGDATDKDRTRKTMWGKNDERMGQGRGQGCTRQWQDHEEDVRQKVWSNGTGAGDAPNNGRTRKRMWGKKISKKDVIRMAYCRCCCCCTAILNAAFWYIFSRVLRDSTPRFVGPSVGPSVHPSVTLYFFWGLWDFWLYCFCPNDLVTSIQTPAHPHATGVAVYPALFL